MKTILIVGLLIIIAIVYLMAYALCKAAAAGDRMLDLDEERRKCQK